MKIINNIFNEVREIKGFNQDDIVEVKRTVEKLKTSTSESTEMNSFIESKFPIKIIEDYSKYISDLTDFVKTYLIEKIEPESEKILDYSNLKSSILREIKYILNNLVNLKSNIRNTKRFLKDLPFLEDNLNSIQGLIESYENLASIIEKEKQKIDGPYDNISYIWVTTNKIKNSYFKINKFPDFFNKWDELKQFSDYIEKINLEDSKKKKNRKKRGFSTLYFGEFYQYLEKVEEDTREFYSDLLFFLWKNKIVEEFEGEGDELGDYTNVIDRKVINNNLKKFFRPIIKSLIEKKLNAILKEIEELDNAFKIEDDKKSINLKTLLEQKISIYLPKIAEYYLSGLEKKYQNTISELKDYDEYKNIEKFYSEKVNILYSIFEELNIYFSNFEIMLSSYKEISSYYKKIVENVLDEINRRRDEYLFYLKTVRKERLRDNVRNYIYEKISEVNDLMGKYQDDTALIVREEFPQLKQIREILGKYKREIQGVKDDVYKTLNMYKEKDIDIYQIIKQWEDNFTFKKQQLSFLLSMMLNKLFKNFKELIEDEDELIANLTEITGQTGKVNNIPLNFALSDYLVDKLTEDELNERMNEINNRIESLSNEINLYQSELINLENTLSDKVKIREGIKSDKIMCGVCHKKFDFAKDQIVKCPFCDAVYHYLCVAFWLSKYNSCPACQNQFLDPGSGLYEEENEE